MALTLNKLSIIFLGFFSFCAYARLPQEILKGKDTLITDFPHMVSIQTPEGKHFCGGTIISPVYILTAAHCIVHDGSQCSVDRYSIVTGTNDRLNRTPDNVFFASYCALHNEFHACDYHKNDIAILKLNRSIPVNEYQRPARLPYKDVPAFATVTSTGWGSTTYDPVTGKSGPLARYLQKLERTVLDQGYCENELTDSIITPGKVCVWSPGGADTCRGDSGGPLTHHRTLVGISSFSFECGQGYPDVYTRVYYYIGWIQAAIKVLNNL